MKKQRPCGIEPYDKEWGVGESAVGENFSPYPRVNHLVKYMHDTEFTVDHERATLITEAYEKHATDSINLKGAKAFKHILQNVSINIYPDELIIGEIAAPMKSAPIFPEFSYSWIPDEIKNFAWEEREIDPYYATDETKKKLLDIEQFWNGKTTEMVAISTMTQEELMGSHLGTGVIFLNLYLHGGIGHVSADYKTLLNLGYSGIRKSIEEKIANLDANTVDYSQKMDFYNSTIIALDGCEIYINRYAQLAKEMTEKELNEERKAELLEIAEVCTWVAKNPPRSFQEALQLFCFATNFILIESNGHSVSYGRFDQYMYPFYEKDIQSGKITKDEAQELIECTLIKSTTPTKLRDRITVMSNSGRGMGGESLTLGGVNERGNDATNDLTFMVLDGEAHIRTVLPWPCVRFHNNTPRELKVKVANVARIGFGHPKIYNDEAAIPASLAVGRTLEDSRNYIVVGCVEIDAAGKEYGWHDSCYMNIARLLELAINDGKWLENDQQVGPQTGYLKDFKSFDEVLEAYDKQMKYWVDLMVSATEKMDIAHQKTKPLPYLSMLIDGCIDKGLDITAGGAIYNFTGPQAVGIGTVADGLSTIKQLVFDEKKVSAEELIKALKNDWVGSEPLYHLVNSDKVHHYGNDDDYADELAQFAFNCYCNHVEGRPNSRGGHYVPGVYSVSANVPHGQLQWASPDGRKANEPVSDCIGPVHTYLGSHDISGPTAIAKSVGKLDHVRAGNGTLLNWKFTPACVSGETGRDNLIALVDEIISQKILHSQFNIISKETLIDAQKNPQKYKHLLVRVAGYSAYFVDLSPALQADLIARTELSFE